ncbi:MAG: response regulator transcription factor [Myxococcaceae bacterium]
MNLAVRSQSSSTSLLSGIAEWACRAASRLAFRRGVLEALAGPLSLEAAVFASLRVSGDAAAAVRGTRLPRVAALWSAELAVLRAGLRPPTRWMLTAPGGREFCATGRPLASCVMRVSARVGSVLAVSRARPFSDEELRFLGELQPVLQLGEERQVEASESVGARLSPRERQIFEYLLRGFRNEDIARALGTSPATVRNQLVRLYRKAGVGTRSELVGRATTRLMAPGGGAT